MARDLPTALRCNASKIVSDQNGGVAILAAVSFPVLIGGIGLGSEVGYWYLKQRHLQHVADLAAYAAGLRLAHEGEGADLEEIALHIATESGFEGGQAGIDVNNPPASGPNAGNPNMVEVVLAQDLEKSFSGFFQSGFVNVSGRAVAEINATTRPACLIALAKSGSGTLSLTGNGNVKLDGCIASANSDASDAIYVHGSGELTAECVYSASGDAADQKAGSIKSDCDPEVQEGSTADPYEGIKLPTKATSCYTPGKKDPAVPANPTRTVGGVKVWDLCRLEVSRDIDLQSGVYILYGGELTDTGQNVVSGTGVTFYLTNDPTNSGPYSRINVNGTRFELTAPTDGDYAGLTFIADEDNTQTQSFGGNSQLEAVGAVRFPGSTVDFGGGSGSGGCVQIIANMITFTGNGEIAFGHSCPGTGTRPATVGSGKVTVQLKE